MYNENKIDIRHEIDFHTPAQSDCNKSLFVPIGLFVACLAVTFMLLVVSSPAMAASAVILKQDTFLSDNVVTVGDVFENAGEFADHVLAPAPAAGDTMVLGAYDLGRIASAFNLDWQPMPGMNQIVLQRAVSEVEKSEIARMVEAAVKEKMGSDNLDVSIDSVIPRMIMDGTDAPEITIKSTLIDTINNKFDVRLAIKGANNSRENLDLNGSVYRTTDIPVLTANYKNGDVIRAGDIKMVNIRQDNINQSIALKADDLIGMTPRRSLTSDKPVRMADLERPEMVAKGQAITMVLQNGPMTLTAKGKAMESGAKGDIIRVLNTESNRTIEAVVSAPQRVTIALETNRI